MAPVRLARCLARPPLAVRYVSSLNNLDPSWSALPNQVPDAPESDSSGKQQQSQRSSAIETVLATILGLGLVGGLGVAYHNWYKWDVLRKMELAFKAGYDPVLELEKSSTLTALSKAKGAVLDEGEDERIRRREQDLIDRIVNGEEVGHYYLLMGQKGVGKASMVIQAMVDNEADGCAFVEAHQDAEVFRLRLGKALLFEYNEDYYGALFQRRDPRDAGPMLDIERALNKLEKVALRFRRKRGRPPVLIFNNLHLISNDDAGHALLHMLQQRAESWAQAGALTMVFLSDDHWIYQSLRKNASRLSVVSVSDLSLDDSIAVIAPHRQQVWGESRDEAEEIARKVYSLVGGRLSYLSQLVRRRDMIDAAHEMIEREKGWLLSRVPMMGTEVSSSSFLLFQELARLADEAEAKGEDPTKVSLPYWRACEVMTRADFLPDLDHQNMIAIDVNHHVRADSTLLLNVMRELVNEEGFQKKLDDTRARIDDIESLHRTAELTVKPDQPGLLRLRGW